jgi:CHAD domain-containing protein
MNEFVKTQTLAGLERFQQEVRKSAGVPTNADAIHDLRVSMRRLSQCLEIFAAFLDPAAIGKARKKIKRLMNRCGAVRNCDITLDLLKLVKAPEHAKSARSVKKRRNDAEQVLTKHLERWGEKDIRKDWSEKLLVDHDGDLNLDPDLRTWTKEWFARGRLAAAPSSTHHAMHLFRLEVKRFRYTIEILQPMYGTHGADPILEGLRELQSSLGDMNDCVSALDLLEDYPKPVRAIRKLLTEREQAFRALWKEKFGIRRQTEWISIFSATAKPSPAQRPSRKPTGSSRRKDAAMSAA